jgi:hypothetical protein
MTLKRENRRISNKNMKNARKKIELASQRAFRFYSL